MTYLYHGFHLLPVIRTPPAQWLDIPVVSTVPVLDAGGVAYANDLQLTEGFWTLAVVYAAWSGLLRWWLRRRQEEE